MRNKIIPHGKAEKFELKKGDKIKILIPFGGQVSDIVFEGFNQSITREKLTYSRHVSGTTTPMAKTLEQGECLYNCEGKPILLLKENNVSELSINDYFKILPDHIDKNRLFLQEPLIKPTHDLLWPGCSSEIYKNEKKGCRELLSEVLDLELKNLPSVCSLFMTLGSKNNIIPSPVQKNDNVVFEALEDVLLGVTSCPDDWFCNLNPSEVNIIYYKNGSAGI